MMIPDSIRYFATIAIAALFISCSDDPAGPPPPDPVFIGSSVVSGPVNVLSAVVTVNATNFSTASLVMRTPGEADMLSPAYVFDGSEARPAALGLLPDRTYEIDVMVTANGTTELGETLTFTTGSLPVWLPEITPVGTPAEDGFLALAHPDGPVIIDNMGRVRWYVGSPDPTLISFMSHPNGEYTLFGLVDAARVHRALDELGQVVRTLGCIDHQTRVHDIRVQADGGYWVLCQNPIDTDLTSRGGGSNVTVFWTIVQHNGLPPK